MSTRTRYRETQTLHIDPWPIGKMTLPQVTPEDVSDWQAALTTGPTARKHAYDLVAAMYRQAVRDDLVDKSPCRLTLPRAQARQRVTTIQTVLAITGYLPERYRLLPILALFYLPRKGELLALTRADVEPGGVVVRRRFYQLATGPDWDTPKTQAGTRFIAPIPAVDDLIQAHLNRWVRPEPDALLFTTRTGRHVVNFNNRWNRARNLAGHPGLTLHDLRRSGATMLATDAGATNAELQARLDG